MNAEPASEIRSLATGIRTVALVFVLILGYFNLRWALGIDTFHRIFMDMLGGKALPGLTMLVFQYSRVLIVFACLIPLAALAVTFWCRNHRNALCSLAGLMAAAFLQMHVVGTAIMEPFYAITTALSQP
jgi:hypothetical protein